jgi:hypothetical protein
MVYTSYKNGDDWGMAYEIVLTTIFQWGMGNGAHPSGPSQTRSTRQPRHLSCGQSHSTGRENRKKDRAKL